MRRAVVAGLIVAAVFMAACQSGGSHGTASTVTTTTTSSTTPVPSQSPIDAQRDGVVGAVGALPFDQRVKVIQAASAPEGRWVVSRMPARPDRLTLGSPGLYGKDFVNTNEYGELLLLDRVADRIIRAFPLPGLPPQAVLVTARAVYCLRQGDAGLPDSMLCRIDRQAMTWTARIFPSQLEPNEWKRRYAPSNWTIDKPQGAFFRQLSQREGRLVASGQAGSVVVDQQTLAITGNA